MIRWAGTALAEEARELSVSPRLAAAAFLLPLGGGVVVLAARADRDVFRFLVAEDSLLEWLQVAGYVAAAALALAVARRLRAHGSSFAALAFGGFAVGCLFIAGEEIAWGQRLVGFGTPEPLAEINEQGEVTVHNIDTVQQLFSRFVLVAGLYGAAAPWLLRARGGRAGVAALFVPPLAVSSAFAVAAAYKLTRLLVLPEPGFTVTKVGEWPETCLALGFAGLAFGARRRLRRAAAEREEAAEPGRLSVLDAEAQQSEVAAPGALSGRQAGRLLQRTVHPARVEERLD
jgi:hypothetical protein